MPGVTVIYTSSQETLFVSCAVLVVRGTKNIVSLLLGEVHLCTGGAWQQDAVSSGKGLGREGREYSFLQFSSKQTKHLCSKARVNDNFTIPKDGFYYKHSKRFLCDPAVEWLNTEKKAERKREGEGERPCCKPWDYSKYPKEIGQNTSINNNKKPQTYKKQHFFEEIAIHTPEADNSKSGQLGITSILLTNLKEKQSKAELSCLTPWSLNTHSKRKQQF